MSVTALKVAPHSIETEQAVLGSLMLLDSAWDRVAGRINEDDFYRKDHRVIFQAIAEMAEKDLPRDIFTVSEWLKVRELLDDAGGMPYLGALANEAGSAANVETYAQFVRDRSLLRNLIGAGTHITELGYTPGGRPTHELVDEAERKVMEVAESGRKIGSGPKSGSKFLARAVEKLDELIHGSGLAGTSTGIDALDAKTTGLHPGELIIVAGRPSMGKTSFSMNIAEAVCTNPESPKGVLVFSLEMPGDQLMTRMLASLARINQENLRTGNLTDHDWDKITSTVKILDQAPLYIDDEGGLSPTEIRARARRLKREMNNRKDERFPDGVELGLIVVDYLQLMQIKGGAENRTNEIAEISRNLKALAKELEVPVIALSQLNRAVESRDDKRPRMSDIRESGGIEQDADLILFIYREVVYKSDTERPNVAEVIIAKQRNGPIGKVETSFLGQYTRFENLARADEYDDWE